MPSLVPSIQKNQPGIEENNHPLKFLCSSLPGYAQFLLNERIGEIAIKQLDLLRYLKVPIFRFFESLSEEELIQRGIQNLQKMLGFFSRNQADLFIEDALQTFLSNRIPFISREQVMPEDITQISFIRRKIFRDFLFDYTIDPDIHIQIMEEIDQILVELDSASLKNLFGLHQELYKQSQSISQIGNWVLDIQTDKRIWSEEMYKIYELDPNTVISKILSAYHYPEDQKMIQDEMEKARRTMKPFDFYYRILLPSGKRKFLRAKGDVVKDESGSAKSIYGTVQDVTQQKEAENELKSNQLFIKKITDLTPAIIVTYNIHSGKNHFINEAIYTMLGYNPEEVLNQGNDFFNSIIHPEDLEEIKGKNAQILAFANLPEQFRNNEMISELNYRIRHKNGNYRWFQSFSTIFSRNANKLVEEVLNIYMDISEQVNTSQQLREKNETLVKNEERFHKMTENVEDYSILLLSRDGIIENWNKGAEKIKGYKADEVVGRHFRIFYSKEDQESGLPEKLIHKAMLEGKANHEGWRTRKSGETFWSYVVITALRDRNSEVFGFSKVTRDLTEKKKAEERLQHYADTLSLKNRELEQINKELESFTYMASHDLQEPLRKVKTFTNFILEKEPHQFSVTTKDYFSRIVSAADRMQHLIEALFDYSRVNDPKTFLRENIDLNSLLTEVKNDLNDLIREKKAHIEYSDLPNLKVIPLQFHQLFSNLITNSLKYSRQGFDPEISIMYEKVPRQEIGMDTPFPYIHKISFIDNGIGFDQQYAEKIFEIFQRLHGKMEYSGTGIGLAICKKIIQNHYGIIRASGESGIGARFEIFLPIEN